MLVKEYFNDNLFSRLFVEENDPRVSLKQFLKLSPDDSFIMEPNKKYTCTLEFEVIERLKSFAEKVSFFREIYEIVN